MHAVIILWHIVHRSIIVGYSPFNSINKICFSARVCLYMICVGEWRLICGRHCDRSGDVATANPADGAKRHAAITEDNRSALASASSRNEQQVVTHAVAYSGFRKRANAPPPSDPPPVPSPSTPSATHFSLKYTPPKIQLEWPVPGIYYYSV